MTWFPENVIQFPENVTQFLKNRTWFQKTGSHFWRNNESLKSCPSPFHIHSPAQQLQVPQLFPLPPLSPRTQNDKTAWHDRAQNNLQKRHIDIQSQMLQ